jgi:hypothetical protein
MTMLQSKEKHNSKKMGEYYATIKNDLTNIRQKKYFLICESCYWMATTLQNYHPSCNNFIIFKQCPVCENKIDRFTIPPDLN